MKTIEELERQIDELKAEIGKLKKSEEKQSNRWKPESGRYWSISGDAEIYENTWNYYPTDEGRYSIGNCFRTKEEAEFELERLKVIAELKEFAESDDAVWDECKEHWFIRFIYYLSEIDSSSTMNYRCGELYFPTKEIALKAIKAVGEDRIKKYYLRVKER